MTVLTVALLVSLVGNVLLGVLLWRVWYQRVEDYREELRKPIKDEPPVGMGPRRFRFSQLAHRSR